MNALLLKGKIRNVHGEDIVTCPLHFATFDIVTGKNHLSQRCLLCLWIWQLPKPLQDALAQAAQIRAFVKTYDMETLELERDGEDVKLKIIS